ncbi:hypothetical protein PENSPDRAFT_321826 [Peniophora sp. CONT]|nr:hypothetical protein PENSPDRAFT_321826 [Peniophora sp. CONT]
MSSTPDIANLTISGTPRGDVGEYEGRPQYHFQTATGVPQSAYNNLGVNQSPLKNKPSRAGLPTGWMDSAGNPYTDSRSMSPGSTDLSSGGGSPPLAGIQQPPMLSPSPGVPIGDEDIIPTAIVIKNIPFNVKRETLLDIIASLSIPTPYAFNYHLDQSGSFRGLAFANFRASSDADAVVAALNGFDVQGRKLRVEYKKVLQAGEKERIEREKAIRRMRSMQMERGQVDLGQPQQQNPFQQQQGPGTPYDDFGQVIPPTFSPHRSFSGHNPYAQFDPVPPMPVPQPYGQQQPLAPAPPPPALSPAPSKGGAATELDLNDPATLEIYSRILLFKDDMMRDELAFSRTLSPKQRRIVHLVAQKLGVYHYSVGEGEDRYAVVTRIDPEKAQRHPGLTRTPSAAYLSATSPTSTGLAQALRAKKSMPDMKTLQAQRPDLSGAPRLNTRLSNGNMREGYNTIASPPRRSPATFAGLFSPGGGFGVPPVPALPAGMSSPGAGPESPSVLRQPRGPAASGGFGTRRDRVVASESQAPSRGVEARSHEPLEL